MGVKTEGSFRRVSQGRMIGIAGGTRMTMSTVRHRQQRRLSSMAIERDGRDGHGLVVVDVGFGGTGDISVSR